MNTHKVYKTVHVLSGRYYIGKTNGNNPTYLGSGTLFQKYLKKHGPDCSRSIAINTANQFHFDNCKERKEVNHAQLA